MNSNLFGNGNDDDNDANQYSRFIKKETYDTLMITFSAVTAGITKKPTGNANHQEQEQSTSINVLTKTMVASSPRDSDAQRQYAQTQSQNGSGSCDLVYVPTSFVIEKDTLNAFYEFKKMKNDGTGTAAASVFMQRNMFEQFVKFVNKNAHARELALIEQSYNAAINRFPGLIVGMSSVQNLSSNDVQPISANLNERFTILYTTPTDPELMFLPLASDFDARGKFGVVMDDASADHHPAIAQKALTYFCNYFQYLYMKSMPIGSAAPTLCSVGRIPTYLPALNSNIGNGTATNVHFKDVDATATATAAAIYAKPSYNVEIITDFLRGIITGIDLPNRAQLTNADKLKVIQDKTQLYTFRSTADYSMNYDAMLKRLYYKYPCHLTPSATVSKDARDKIAASSRQTGTTTFAYFLSRAINAPECDKTKSHFIICAVAIATREFILYNELNDIEDDVSRDSISIALSMAGNIYFPLIGAASAAGDAVHAAAKLAITKLTMANARADPSVKFAAMKTAMDLEIDNFAAFMYDNDTLLSLLKYSDQAQTVNADVKPENLLPKADYLKTLYETQPTQPQSHD